MKSTKIVVSQKKVEEYSGPLLVIFVARNTEGVLVCDSLPDPTVQWLQDLKEFTGKKDQSLLLYPEVGRLDGVLHCQRLLLLGLGDLESFTQDDATMEMLRVAGGTVAGQCRQNKIETVAVCIPEFTGLKTEFVGENVIEGALLGAYQFLKYKQKDDDAYSGLKKLELFSSSGKSKLGKAVDRGRSSARAACVARDMANEPGNCWTPGHFARYAQKIAKELHLRCTILEKATMAKLGMGGIIAVNKGSNEPPKLIILEYRPEKATDTVLLVGKGLTFDSGGISLKPAQGMMDMKYDMCGGAAVLAAIEAIAREELKLRVVAIIPSTDNMAGGGAVKPGDIITHYGGITSEIENTDAEGRLILADALAYGIEKFQPTCVIDLATLTGAVIIALGHHYSGLLSNSDQLTEKLLEAGKICGEPLWRLPLGKVYAKQLESKVADTKNTGGRPAGCITAAEYLHQFVGEVPWAHLDIAGTAWDFTEKSYIPKGPSGIGVRTLLQLVRRWEKGALVSATS